MYREGDCDLRVVLARSASIWSTTILGVSSGLGFEFAPTGATLRTEVQIALY